MGFPSPATDYAEQRMSLDSLVSLQPHATYFMKAGSDYVDVGILKGSLLVIDRSLQPTHGSLLVSMVDEEFQIRRYISHPFPALQELTSTGGSVKIISEENDLEESPIWGVIAYVLTSVSGKGFGI